MVGFIFMFEAVDNLVSVEAGEETISGCPALRSGLSIWELVWVGGFGGVGFGAPAYGVQETHCVLFLVAAGKLFNAAATVAKMQKILLR